MAARFAAVWIALAWGGVCSACDPAYDGFATCPSRGSRIPGEHALIQVRGPKLASSSLLAQPPANASSGVAPLNCSAHSAPLQVVKQGDGYDVRELDIESGVYTSLYALPYSLTSPPYKALNACGVGPLDSIAYCVVWMPSDDFFVVRFDSGRMEFVTKFPDWCFKATFSKDGTYYAVVGKTRLYKIHDLHLLPGFQSYDDPALADTAPAEYIEIPASGHDIVLVSADFEDSGVNEYLVSALFDMVFLTRTTGAPQSWTLEREDPDRGLSTNFGAGWSYQDRVFFASNRGDGIYEVDLSTVNLTALSVQTRRVGPSVNTHQNDGMNCMNTKVPKAWTEASCVLWGEPHIRVFDSATDSEAGPLGAVVDMFDVGDYWLVRSEQISIQGRYLPTQWSNGQAATSALAVGGAFLKNHVLIIESMSGEVRWDGERILDALPSEFSVRDLLSARFHSEGSASSLVPGHMEAVVKTVDLELPLGVRITVNRWTKHIDVIITMRPQPGGQDGHCGNFNADAADDTAELLKQRVGGQVEADDLLFTQGPPAGGDDHDGGDAPPPSRGGAAGGKARVTLDDCPAAVRARAEALCGERRRANRSAVRSSCVFDVCFGGEEYAQANVAMDMQVADAPTPVSIRWSLHSSLCLDVGGGQPVNGSVLQVWSCHPGHADMVFLLPAGGVGQIRWATYPDLCIDVARGADEVGTRVQLWECQVGHRDMQFILPSDGKGEIRWAADPTMCLDVREGDVELGTRIQLWKCMGDGQANQVFEVSSGASA